MKFLVQRVTEASVEVDGRTVGEISRGYMVLIGVGDKDSRADADRLVKKLIGLRIFPDQNGRTNLSLSDVGGGLLLISQFTLYADTAHGNRPSFTRAGEPKMAKELYEYVIAQCKKSVPKVESGIFGAKMEVRLTNDGPFTILLES